MEVPSLGQEDALEEEMATHSSIFAWRIPWTEEPGGLQSMGLQRVGHDWNDWTQFFILSDEVSLFTPRVRTGPVTCSGTMECNISVPKLNFKRPSCTLGTLLCHVNKLQLASYRITSMWPSCPEHMRGQPANPTECKDLTKLKLTVDISGSQQRPEMLSWVQSLLPTQILR